MTDPIFNTDRANARAWERAQRLLSLHVGPGAAPEWFIAMAIDIVTTCNPGVRDHLIDRLTGRLASRGIDPEAFLAAIETTVE